jgi:hypothetical protein
MMISFASITDSPAIAGTVPTITLFDMVGALAPAGQSRPLPIFTDAKFKPGTACMLTYGSTPALKPLDVSLFTNATSASNMQRIAHKIPWTISTWVTRQTYPNLCTDSRVFVDGNSINMTNTTSTRGWVPFAVLLQPHSITMNINSRVFWQEVYGIGVPLYRKNTNFSVSWPNIIINKTMHSEQHDLIWLDQIGSSGDLRLIFDGQLNSANIDKGSVVLPPNTYLPAGAQLQYDPRKHGTQLRLSFGITYALKPEELASYHCLAQNPLERMPVCANNGKYFHYMVAIFADRYNYQSLWRPYWKKGTLSTSGEDIGTNAMMYGASLESLMSTDQREAWFQRGINPYRQPGQRFRLDVNLYPLIRHAILETATQKMVDYAHGRISARPMKSALPPRQSGETDDQYIGHFVIGSANIGYEVSGLSDVSFTIYDFRLLATLGMTNSQTIH